MQSLPLFHRIAGTPVIVLGEGEAAEAKRRLVERAGGLIVTTADAEARLAFVALDEPDTTAAQLRARGVLVNVPDRPDLCDFTVPSLLDRTPVLIAIGTSGASAGLAKALRLRLEGMLPAGLGALANRLASARSQMRKAWPEPGVRRRALDAALASGGVLDLLNEASADRVEEWLEKPNAPAAQSTEQVQLRSADPDDLTLREARLLGSADVIFCRGTVPPAILARARADARRIEDGLAAAIPAGSGVVVIVHGFDMNSKITGK